LQRARNSRFTFGQVASASRWLEVTRAQPIQLVEAAERYVEAGRLSGFQGVRIAHGKTNVCGL
jgi:hypothetical protein